MSLLSFKNWKASKKMLTEQNMLKKDVLNFTETAIYLEVSHSHLYKLTSNGVIPCYKPNGKKLYFKRSELDHLVTFKPADNNR